MIGPAPLHVPDVAVRVSPCLTVPAIVGGDVFTGVAVADDRARAGDGVRRAVRVGGGHGDAQRVTDVAPAGPVGLCGRAADVRAACRRPSCSAASGSRSSIGDEPDHDPLDAVSVPPTDALPEIVGGAVFDGRGPCARPARLRRGEATPLRRRAPRASTWREYSHLDAVPAASKQNAYRILQRDNPDDARDLGGTMGHNLEDIARALVAPGKGILAADESERHDQEALRLDRRRVDRGQPARLPRPAVHDRGRGRPHQRRDPLRRDDPPAARSTARRSRSCSRARASSPGSRSTRARRTSRTRPARRSPRASTACASGSPSTASSARASPSGAR